MGAQTHQHQDFRALSFARSAFLAYVGCLEDLESGSISWSFTFARPSIISLVRYTTQTG